jgi:shikimate dehydrogenase
MINKDTTICCSFSQNPTNKGCEFFNKRFTERKMNWAYKAFKIENIRDAVQSMRTLGFRGAGVSMPFKTECLHAVDDMSEEVKTIWAANTIVNDNGELTAYNTDWLAARTLIDNYLRRLNKIETIMIYGTGGLSKAVQYACKSMGISCVVFTRGEIEKLFDESNLPEEVDQEFCNNLILKLRNL